MGKITIGVIRQRRVFMPPDKEKNVLEVPYTTSKGFSGQVTIDKVDATQQEIIKRVKEDAILCDGLINLEISTQA